MLIAFGGEAGAGKDTAASFLVEKQGFERLSFADPVRASLLAVNPYIPITGAVLDPSGQPITRFRRLRQIVEDVGWDVAKKNPEVRALLQRTGTEMGRDILTPGLGLDRSMWVAIAEHQVASSKRTNFVISDCRFKDEEEWIHSHAGITVRITRPGFGPINEHVSDNLLDQLRWNAVIGNDGSIEQLQGRVLSLVNAYFADQDASTRVKS
jgi:hypothetical protein